MAACAAYDVPVIINDHVELAVELGAAGAHVGQDDAPTTTAREMLTALLPHIQGAQIAAPFGRYLTAVDVARAVPADRRGD